MKGQFIEQFNQVFNEDSTIKTCGREKCKSLINIADTIEPEISHGCKDSGMLNIESLIALKNKLTYKE